VNRNFYIEINTKVTRGYLHKTTYR